MATIKCGFFNSINKDRMYTAEEMTRPYELLVSNGVFATKKGEPSDYLQVYAGEGMNLTIKGGRGIFFDKWFLLDGDLSMAVESAEVTLKRIDSVVVRVDCNEAVRAADIIIKKGTPSSLPVAPALERNSLVKEYRLANIAVDPGITAIKQLNITDTRGILEDCGWVTSLIDQVDTTTLYIQWQDAFDTWFKDVKETLATATLIREYTEAYTTTVQDETVIPIGIPQYNFNLDILNVFINGLMLIRDVEYTVDNNDNITLTAGVDAGTPVSFVVYKSVDGSEAETVVQQVYQLQLQMDKIIDGELTEFNVDGPIRIRGLQLGFTDGTTNLQLGTTALPTTIHGKDDIFLNTRCNARSIVPNANDSYQIGDATKRYRSIYLTGNPNISSDVRLKQDIKHTDPDELLKFINRLNVVTYAYKSDPKTERIGLIAQEVELAGGFKYVDVDDGMYGLRTADLVYPLISAVQALSKRVSDLESQLKKQ